MYALHPMLVHLPIGVLLAATLFAWLAELRHTDDLARTALACLGLGLIAAVPAVFSGLFDAWRQLSGPDVARNDPRLLVSNLHAFSTLAASGLYLRAWLLWRRGTAQQPAARRLLTVGAVLLVIGGWLGGQLVYRYGMGQL